jgi:hypothetical protein
MVTIIHENYSEKYKIELCNTLPTKIEIRKCLEQKAQEYKQESYLENTVIGFVFLAMVIWFCYMFYKN